MPAPALSAANASRSSPHCMWTIDGEHVIEYLAGIEDFQLAMATYHAASKRWPGAAIILRQGAKVAEDNRQVRTA